MNAVEFRRQTQIGAIVHDQANRATQDLPEFLRVVENSPCRIALVPVLEQRNAGSLKFTRGSEHRSRVGKAARVEDGIEAREWSD